MPVKLVSVSRSHLYRVELDESGASTPNYCLLEKLKQTFQLEISGLAQPVEDESGIDLDAALNATRMAIRSKGFSFRVEPTADVAILQFAKFRLWKDLDENWERLMSNSLVSHLVTSPTEPFEDPVPSPDGVNLDELDSSCPIPADASQLEAVAQACGGRTFVLEGPPGTGKSQTITNLLTRAVADGKRVLFVAEKRAALDVVSARLDSVGMGTFSLDLHDKGSKPTVVRAQIKAALDHAVGVDEQGLAAQQETLRTARRNLLRYAQMLHEPNGAGLSYYSARTSLLALGDGVASLPIPHRLLQPGAGEALAQVRRALVHLPDVAYPARPAADHPWGFVGCISTQERALEILRDAARALDAALSRVVPTGELGATLRTARSSEDLTVVAAVLNASPVTLTVLDETRTPSWRRASSALAADVASFATSSHPGLDVATAAVLDLPLADIHARAQAAAASGFFGRGKRLKAVLAQLQPALRPGVEIKPKSVPETTMLLMGVKQAAMALVDRAAGIAGIQLPAGWNPLTPTAHELVDRQITWLTWAGETVDGIRHPGAFVSSLRHFIQSAATVEPAQAGAVQALADAAGQLTRAAGGDVATFDHWLGKQGLLDRWVSTDAGRDLSDESVIGVRRWVPFIEALEPLRAANMDEAREALRTGSIHADDAVRAFDRGLAVASIAERRESTGLDAFDPQSHDRTVRRFTESAAAVRAQMATAVPHEVLNRRPFQPSSGRGQVGALQRELAKQRRGLGVRRLLETYGELITQLMPCVLVSPDSVSRFFPVGSQVFDLVVFDEASQIRVADAIGAMGRSRSVVVVGDSKQMPPTSFAEPRIGSDDDAGQESLVVEDEESILTESVLARVPRRWLTWHYRSQDESLISFSNRYYYEDKLSSFPAPHDASSDSSIDGYGVSLVRVAGTFLRAEKGKLLRTNPVEADAIVAEIRRRFAASSGSAPSIGVVTFNQQQRAHIEGLIRDSQDERLIEALDGTNGEGLFIKNLENVQGDERDVILFSTAFSVNEKGYLPLNFGPLNTGGGERRLNVAITRARRQVIIFSSFDPTQLRADETQSVGIKHLRAYLDMAALGAQAMGPSPHQRTRVPDRHRDEVADALRARGLVVNADVGLSEFKIDLTIARPEDPEHPLVAVLLDGEGWFHRRTVGDRDGLPVQVLSAMLRWPAVERVWMPEWLAQREVVLKRLENVTRSARASGPAPVTSPTSAAVLPREAETNASSGLAPARVIVSRERPAGTVSAPAVTPLSTPAFTAGFPALAATPRVGRSLTGETPFVPWQVRRLGSRDVLDDLPAPYAAAQVQQALELVVKAEGPIHVDRLARQVAGGFELTRVSPARGQSILTHLPRHLRRDKSEPFAWPDEIDPYKWTGFRRAAESDPRPLEQVSLLEIGNAMVSLVHDSAGMNRDELLREALAVFGGKRLTPGISARLQSALSSAMARGFVTLSPNGMVRPAIS